MRAKGVRLSLLGLGLLHAIVICAGFFAPYDSTAQDRASPFAPPTRLRFVDEAGRFHWRPFVYRQTVRAGTFDVYEEDHSVTYPVRFFVEADSYRIAGIVSLRRRLFGVDEPARIFLIGSDDYGRDQWSRLLHGGQISLFAGLLAAVLSLGVGLVLGAWAGYFGGWLDEIVMRGADLFLALPWLYLLFAVRAFLPLHLEPGEAFLLLIAVLAIIGWARPARLVRGVVLSAREQDYVVAARSFGASHTHLLIRHVLPQTSGVLLTQAALLVPHYILAEVTLSFLGLGVSEPAPSWGNMLTSLQQYHVLVSYWWMFLPALVLIPVFLGYYTLTTALRQSARY